MPKLQPVKIIIAGVDRFSRQFSKAGKQLDIMGRRSKTVGSRMSTGFTIPILAAGTGITMAGVKFQASMNKVEAITQATSKQMDKMTNLAKQLGIQTRFSASEAADAMVFLGMAGWQTSEILKGTPNLLNLSAASMTDLGRTADITSNIMGQFRLSANQTKKVTDILSASTASANVTLEMLSETFEDAGPIAKDFGASLKDAAIIGGTLGNIGIQGSKAGTAMKNIFTILSSPTPNAQKWFDRLQLKIADANGNIREFGDIFLDLGGKLSKLTQVERLNAIKEIFGKIPIAAASALSRDLSSANSEFFKLSKRMAEVDGRAGKMAKTMMKGAVGAFKAFTSALEGMAIEIANSGFLDFLSSVAIKLTEIMRAIARFNPAILKFGVILAGLVAIAGPLLFIVGNIVGALGSFSLAVSAAGGMMAFLASPLVIIAGLVAKLAMIFGVIIAVGTNLKNRFGKIAFVILTRLSPIGALVAWIISKWDKLIPYFRLFATGIGKIFNAISDGPVGRFFSWIGDMIEWIGDKIAKLLDTIVLGGLSSLAQLLFSDEELKAAGLSIDESGANKDRIRQGAMATGQLKSKDELEIKVSTDDNSKVEIVKQPEKAKVKNNDGTIMPGVL